MSKRQKSANRNETGAPHRHDVDDEDRPLWSEDEDIASGRSWSLILVFLVVPLAAITVLGLCVYVLFASLFGGLPA